MLRFPKPSLGRIYPADIEALIEKASETLDSMMASSVALSMAADIDLSGQISDLNTRLVNDVILPSDNLSDDDARSRLGSILNDAQGLKAIFDQNGITLGYGSGQFTANAISKRQGSDLSSQMDKAFNTYASIVDRYGLVRGYVGSSSVIPETGQKLSDLLSTFDVQIKALDQKLPDMHKYADDLATANGNASNDAVSIDRTEVQKMQQWAASVFQADDALKRIEGVAFRKPIESTPAARLPSSTPWPLIGIAGIALVGLAFFAIQD